MDKKVEHFQVPSVKCENLQFSLNVLVFVGGFVK